MIKIHFDIKFGSSQIRTFIQYFLNIFIVGFFVSASRFPRQLTKQSSL